MIGATVHELKTWPEYWDALAGGFKKVEIRKNDRSFREGDYLLLRQWVPNRNTIRISKGEEDELLVGEYTGRCVMAKVTHILTSHSPPGGLLPTGYVAMSIDVLDVKRE